MSADEETITPDKAATPASGYSTPADEQRELTEKDIEEKDGRPCFFRHVTVIVKLCAFFLVAGKSLALSIRHLIGLQFSLQKASFILHPVSGYW